MQTHKVTLTTVRLWSLTTAALAILATAGCGGGGGGGGGGGPDNSTNTMTTGPSAQELCNESTLVQQTEAPQWVQQRTEVRA